jgi:phytoene dehydrogenase-like protein
MEARPVAVVVGAGVNGLSCAVRLLEAGVSVLIL